MVDVTRGMPRMGIGGHQLPFKGKKDEWLTPPEIINELGPFDLDPCSPCNRPCPTANNHYTETDDGLNHPWYGSVWCNPPYGPETGTWLNRLAAHGNGIALIFARTETSMFFNEVWDKADAVLFIKGRLFFHHVSGERAKHNSGAPSCLIAYGKDAVDRLKKCDIDGKLIILKGSSDE